MLDLDKYGITIGRTADRAPAYRLTQIRKLTGDENRGSQNIFVRVWDETGRRLTWPDLRIRASAGRPDVFRDYLLDKPATAIERGHGDVPMYPRTPYTVSIVDARGHRSDQVAGLRTDHPDEEQGNTWGHHSFYLEFTLTASSEDPWPPSGDDADGEVDPDRAAVRVWLAEADDLIPQLEDWLKRGRELIE